MTQRETAPIAAASLEEIQQGWHELTLRVGQLEIEKAALEQENKALQALLDRVIAYRQKSHTELVLLLTTLVSKLPINDVGVIVARLVEHGTNVNEMLAALAKGAVGTQLPQPTILKALDDTKRDLAAAMKPVVEELIQLDTPLENGMLQSLLGQPDLFFAPPTVRANRCFVKGQVPRERVIREFGEEALIFFNDMTTDPKLNPRPKKEEIVLAFKNDFEALFQQNPALIPNKRQELLALHQRIQRGKAPTEQARSQKMAFQKLSFMVELLHFYEHQNTEAPDVIFAQHLPALVEQLVLTGPHDALDEKLIVLAEHLMAFVISTDHRQMIVNNVGKSSAIGKTLKYVLKLRAEKVPDLDEAVTEFVKHLIPLQQAPQPESLTPVLRLLNPDMQRLVVKSVMSSDRLRKEDAEALGRAVAGQLGLKDLAEAPKADAGFSSEQERKRAWGNIKELIARRADAVEVAATMRDRLHAKYEVDEIRQSWITLTEIDPMSLIRICCQLPYLADGRTDPIAKTVLETYVTRLVHEKYAATYSKVVKSLRSMFRAKADSPTLLNFMALVRWASPDAANKLCVDIGMPVPA